ncbi:MAG: DUF86 domain-containing protein [bacterium]|nr:DUF86 domain-containing protein [bacterium]
MSTVLKDEVLVKHIRDAIATIETYTKDISREDFLKPENKLLQDGVVHEFEIIGEAVGKLSDQIKKEYIGLPWSKISSMRNKLIHEYFSISLPVIWKTVVEDLPMLKETVLKIVNSFVEI